MQQTPTEQPAGRVLTLKSQYPDPPEWLESMREKRLYRQVCACFPGVVTELRGPCIAALAGMLATLVIVTDEKQKAEIRAEAEISLKSWKVSDVDIAYLMAEAIA